MRSGRGDGDLTAVTPDMEAVALPELADGAEQVEPSCFNSAPGGVQ
ncbi:MAG TPA: hypothetical protein VF456_10920 [Vicinamibacterales bacterium]